MHDAIATSVAEDRTVTIGFDGGERVIDALDENADVEGSAESAEFTEYWGETDGGCWRVYVLTADVD